MYWLPFVFFLLLTAEGAYRLDELDFSSKIFIPVNIYGMNELAIPYKGKGWLI